MSRFRPLIVLLAVIWAVEAVNVLLGHGLAEWGIRPRSLVGLVGIPLAPFIHASPWHALANTVPLAILGALASLAGAARFREATLLIIVLSGALVWLFARAGHHVGASGLVFGYFGLLLGRAIFERSLIAFAVAGATVALYGGIVWGVLPTRSYISFEAHLFGLIAGVVVAWMERRFGGTARG